MTITVASFLHSSPQSNTNQNATWTVPSGVSSITALLAGGGGGGGRSNATAIQANLNQDVNTTSPTNIRCNSTIANWPFPGTARFEDNGEQIHYTGILVGGTSPNFNYSLVVDIRGANGTTATTHTATPAPNQVKITLLNYVDGAGGGGGGGGQVQYQANIPVTPGEVLSVTTGFGGLASGAAAGDGGFSEISRGGLVSAGGTSIIKALGGFGAGTTINGAASGGTPAGALGSGVTSPNPTTCTVRGGGGGGSNTTAGGAGSIPSTTITNAGGAGGAGTSYTLNGVQYTLGGGGGGGTSFSGGSGGTAGTGGGGAGGSSNVGGNGSPNTGGGGGGLGRDPASTTITLGGRGGTGVVYIMYDSVAVSYSVSPTSGVTVVGGNLYAAEGTSVTFTVTTTGVSSGTTLYWGINSGASTPTLSAADFTTASGSFTVTGSVLSATGTFSVPIALDQDQTESEAFSIGIALSQADLGNPFANPVVAANFVATIPTPINITNPVPTYTLTAGSPSNNPGGNILTSGIDEGATVQFTFNVTNYAVNTVFLWEITGNSGDFPTSTGTVTNSQGNFNSSSGTFIIGPTADFAPAEGPETFTVTVKGPTGNTLTNPDSTSPSIGPITINDTTVGATLNKYWYGLRTDGTYANFTGTAGELTLEANLTNKIANGLYAGQYVTIVGTPGVQSTTSNISTTTNTVTLATPFQSTPPVGSKITFHGTTTGTGGFATYYSGKTYYVYSSSSPSSFTLTETAPVQGSVWTCTQIVGTITGSGILVANALSGLIVSPNSTAATVDNASPAQGTIVMPARKAADTINAYSSYAYTATYKIENDPIVSGSSISVKLIQLTGQVAPQSTVGKLNGLTLHFSGDWDSLGLDRSRWFSQTGGAGAKTNPPDLGENAIFDANSGEGVVHIGNLNCQCLSLMMTGSLQGSSSKVILGGVSATTAMITIANSAYLTPYGSSRATRFTPKLKFVSTNSGDFEPNGFLCGDIEIDKHVGTNLGVLTLVGDLTLQQTSTLTMTGGVFVANGKNVTIGKYVSNSTASAGQGRIQMGTGLWTTSYDSPSGSDTTWDSVNTAIEFQTITANDNNVKLAQTKGVAAVATDITTTLPTMTLYGTNTTRSYIEVTDASDLPNNSTIIIDNEFFKYDSWDSSYRPARVFITSRGETLTGITSTAAAHPKKTAVLECSAAAGATLTGMTQSYTTTQIFGLNPTSTDGVFTCISADLTTGIAGPANTTNQPPKSLILVTDGTGTANSAIVSTGATPYSNTGTTYMVTDILGGSAGAVTSFKMQLVSYAQNNISVTPITTTTNASTSAYKFTTNDLRFGTNIGVSFKGATGGTMKIDDETLTYLPGSANAGANLFRITARGITDPVSNRTGNALPHSAVAPVDASLVLANTVAIIAILGNTNWNAVAGTTGVTYTANTVITIKNPPAAGLGGTVWPANAFQVAYRKFSANTTQTFNKLILSSYGTLVHTYFTGGATIKSFTNYIPSLTNVIYPASQELYFNTSSAYTFNSFDFNGSATYIQKIYGYPLNSPKPTLTKVGAENWWDVGMNCTLNSTTGTNNRQTIYKTPTATVDHLSFNYIQGSPIDPARASGYGANFFLTLKD